MTNPLYAYGRGSSCTAITGGAFVPSGLWPAEYDGAYLYGDYGCGRIFTLTRSGSSYSSAEFATGVGGITSMAPGKYNGVQALYFTTFSISRAAAPDHLQRQRQPLAQRRRQRHAQQWPGAAECRL